MDGNALQAFVSLALALPRGWQCLGHLAFLSWLCLVDDNAFSFIVDGNGLEDCHYGLALLGATKKDTLHCKIRMHTCHKETSRLEPRSIV